MNLVGQLAHLLNYSIHHLLSLFARLHVSWIGVTDWLLFAIDLISRIHISCWIKQILNHWCVFWIWASITHTMLFIVRIGRIGVESVRIHCFFLVLEFLPLIDVVSTRVLNESSIVSWMFWLVSFLKGGLDWIDLYWGKWSCFRRINVLNLIINWLVYRALFELLKDIYVILYFKIVFRCCLHLYLITVDWFRSYWHIFSVLFARNLLLLVVKCIL